MEWSEYQKDIFTAVNGIMTSGRDLVVMARAGTGKTVTMVEAVIRFCRAHPEAKVLTCAFNVKNARELDDRLRAAGLDWRQAQAKTLNSVGLATCKKAWGKGVRTDGKKGRVIARELAEAYERAHPRAPRTAFPARWPSSPPWPRSRSPTRATTRPWARWQFASPGWRASR